MRRPTSSTTALKRDVGVDLDVWISAPTTLEFQIAVAPQPGAEVTESLSFTLNGKEIQATEIIGDHGNRIHKFDAGEGSLHGQLQRDDHRPERPRAGHRDRPVDVPAAQPLRRGRQVLRFRRAPSSASTLDSATLLAQVSSWVGTRLHYVPGSSDPIDGAADTLLAGAGVCRDYAHLVVALLRAVNVPARLVAVYAPGCEPMDFHAVAEAYVDGHWRVVDATLSGAAADAGPDQHRSRRRRHRVPRQPQGVDHVEFGVGDGDRRRRPAERLHRRAGVDPLTAAATSGPPCSSSSRPAGAGRSWPRRPARSAGCPARRPAGSARRAAAANARR